MFSERLLELSKTSKMKLLQNNSRYSSANYFCRKLHLRCFTWFWMSLDNAINVNFNQGFPGVSKDYWLYSQNTGSKFPYKIVSASEFTLLRSVKSKKYFLKYLQCWTNYLEQSKTSSKTERDQVFDICFYIIFERRCKHFDSERKTWHKALSPTINFMLVLLRL